MESGRGYRHVVTVSLLILTLTGGVVSGCGVQRVRMSEESGLAQFKFIGIGKSERQEFYDRLGQPIAEYEDRRIIIYRLVRDAHGRLRLGNPDRRWKRVYNLVLVFDADGVLDRRNLVRVR